VSSPTSHSSGRSRTARARHVTAGGAITLVLDADDHPAWTKAALDAHGPGQGRITVHPAPGASHPPGLAQDVLGALGKHLPAQGHGPRHRASWADMVHPAWTAAASWINAHRIGHLTVLRTHTLPPARWAQLAALRARTGIRLTLVWHGKPDARLASRAGHLGAPYAIVQDWNTARHGLHQTGGMHPGTAQRHAIGGELLRPERLGRVGHPLHAGLLAIQILHPAVTPGQLAAIRLGDLSPDVTAIALPHTSHRFSHRRSWQPLSHWAQPLLAAARAWHYLTGHPYPSRRLFQHINFHHHNQLTDVAAQLGIPAAIEHLTADPAWPKADE
jgi:hypothetical protein